MSSTAHSSAPRERSHDQLTPLGAIIVLTAVCSVGTGVLWNGLAFIVKHDYEYAETATLILYTALAFVYVIAALVTGRVLIRLERWMSPRAALAGLLAAQTIACAGPAVITADWMMWITAGVVSVTGAMIWPIVESYLGAGRHGKSMRSAIGWWNVVWTGSVGAALFLMAPLVEHYARFAIVGFGALNLVGFIAIARFPRRPGAHDDDAALASVTSEYPHLLKAARVLLPMSYVLNSGMAPLLPFVLGAMGVQALYETPTAATWTVARVIAVAIMWRVTFWHGRWGTLLLGAISMAIGFALVVSAAHLWMIFAGLSVFGMGMGIVYYAALYYALAVGKAEVDAGGVHEALIGGGYMLGPLLCLISIQAASAARTRGADIADGNVIIIVMWAVLAGSAVLIVRGYLKARRARAGTC